MGVRLMVEVLDHWSDFGLTSGERSDLMVIAENANDRSRETFGSIHALYILHRAGAKSPESWRNTIRKLMRKGALSYAVENGREVRGHPGQTARYRIAHLCPRGEHDGLWGQCERSAPSEWVTSQVTHSEEMGHSSDDAFDEMGHLRSGKWVTSQVTPSPQSPSSTSADAEDGGPGGEGVIPGFESAGAPKPKKKRPAPKKPASPELIAAKDLADKFFGRYGAYYSQSKTSVRKILETSLENGVDRDDLAWAIDGMGRQRRGITEKSLQFALQEHYGRTGRTSGSQSAQRTATRCSEHRLPLPCDSCLGEIKSGDTETPIRLLTQEGPEARWDLAQHLKETA